ncbi:MULTISPECIES: hypothetical protein [unclassified Mesorhizobium]|uniref:hypothetical protein n=1 Tax=unclassified Mesorhizobium TaxID=325217 RepID=UPI00142EE2B9|nr:MULTISPECIES: hypothetical protein [unclassified Mesorhizobium]
MADPDEIAADIELREVQHPGLSITSSPSPSFHGVKPLPGRLVNSSSRMAADDA